MYYNLTAVDLHVQFKIEKKKKKKKFCALTH